MRNLFNATLNASPSFVWKIDSHSSLANKFDAKRNKVDPAFSHQPNIAYTWPVDTKAIHVYKEEYLRVGKWERLFSRWYQKFFSWRKDI